MNFIKQNNIICLATTLFHFSNTVKLISFKYYKPSKEIAKEISKVGVPTFFRQVLFSVSLGFLNQGAVNYGGPNLLAAVGLIYKIIMIPTYIIFGIGQGFQRLGGRVYQVARLRRG